MFMSGEEGGGAFEAGVKGGSRAFPERKRGWDFVASDVWVEWMADKCNVFTIVFFEHCMASSLEPGDHQLCGQTRAGGAGEASHWCEPNEVDQPSGNV